MIYCSGSLDTYGMKKAQLVVIKVFLWPVLSPCIIAETLTMMFLTYLISAYQEDLKCFTITWNYNHILLLTGC